MGVKAVWGILAVSLVSSLISCIGFMLPMHRLDFFAGWAVHLAVMETHATFVRFPEGSVQFCDEMFAGAEKGSEEPGNAEGEKRKSRGWCASLTGEHEIQDVAMHLCAPVVRMIWPQFCDGLNAAYAFGVVLVVTSISNAIMQLIGCYLLYDYITRKANPAYRSAGTLLVAGGAILMMFTMTLYTVFVINNMDSVGGQGWSAALLTTSGKKGFGFGYVLLCCACALQFCTVFFTPYIEKEDLETDYLEAKAQKLEDREYGTFGGLPAPQGGNAPAAMLQSPMGPAMMTAPAPMAHSGAFPMQMGQAPMMMQTGPTPFSMQAPPPTRGGGVAGASAAAAAGFEAAPAGFPSTYDAGPSAPADLESHGPRY